MIASRREKPVKSVPKKKKKKTVMDMAIAADINKRVAKEALNSKNKP